MVIYNLTDHLIASVGFFSFVLLDFVGAMVQCAKISTLTKVSTMLSLLTISL